MKLVRTSEQTFYFETENKGKWGYTIKYKGKQIATSGRNYFDTKEEARLHAFAFIKKDLCDIWGKKIGDFKIECGQFS